MQRHLGYGMGIFLLMGALFLPGTVALAADENPIYGEENVGMKTVIEQLQAENPGLTEAEAAELAGLASAEAQGQGPLTPERLST